MNTSYLNFNFDKSLEDFVKLLFLIDPRNTHSLNEELDKLVIAKERFFNQNHVYYDEFDIDYCGYYLDMLTKFNNCMAYIELTKSDKNRIRLLIVYLLKVLFRQVDSQQHIVQALYMNKSYCIQHCESTKSVTFTPDILYHVADFYYKLIYLNDN